MFEIQAIPEYARPAAEVFTDDDKLYQFFIHGTETYMLFNKRVWNAGSSVSLYDIMSELYETVEPSRAFGRERTEVLHDVFYEKLHHVNIVYGYVGFNVKTQV
jgi:hypothetical protein